MCKDQRLDWGMIYHSGLPDYGLALAGGKVCAFSRDGDRPTELAVLSEGRKGPISAFRWPFTTLSTAVCTSCVTSLPGTPLLSAPAGRADNPQSTPRLWREGRAVGVISSYHFFSPVHDLVLGQAFACNSVCFLQISSSSHGRINRHTGSKKGTTLTSNSMCR